jgi:SAM-dependent methyltransferase
MKLNLGCGHRKLKGYENIDDRKEVKPDKVLDVTEGLPYKKNSVEVVRAYDFLEHVPPDKVIFVMEEIYRVLKPGGTLEHFTPTTDGRGAFQDPTHRSFWNINTWLYFMNDEYRALYSITAKFEGENRDVMTDPHRRIMHTHGVLHAVKD